MSKIGDRIDQDTRSALKSGASLRVSVLRLAKAAIKNQQIALGHELDDVETTAVLQKESKQRIEAAAEFTKGGRVELAAKEQQEAEVLAQYLPAQLTDNELDALIATVITQTGTSTLADMGKVMSAVIAQVTGRADGSRIARLVKARLGA